MTAHRILIVDDEETELKAWARALRLAAFDHVRTERNANEALKLCQEHPFDLVIIDFIMPSMNGVELLQRIRHRLPMIRSIIVSGKIDQKVDPTEIAKTLRGAVEADVYLHKPVTNEVLKAHVNDLLRSASSDPDWRDIAQQALRAKKGTIERAKAAGKELRKLVKREN